VPFGRQDTKDEIMKFQAATNYINCPVHIDNILVFWYYRLMNALAQAISRYVTEIDKIYRAGNATEHSYRPSLKTLFESSFIGPKTPLKNGFTGSKNGLTITNEPKHIECGAPDYIITRNSIPVGYIEAKDIPVGLDNKLNKEQFDRYRQSLNNLIITDYLTFRYYVDGEYQLSVTIAHENKGAIVPDKDQFDTFIELVNQFISYFGKTISASGSLAALMADKSKLLAAVIHNALKDKSDANTLTGQYEGFKKILLHNLGTAEFSDIYAQTLAYGLFAARLNQTDSQTFTRYLAAQLIPQSNPFLRRFFNYIAGIDLDSRIVWIVDALADLFNCVAVEDIKKEFLQANQDPYIHFYETFLAKYNPELRETRGVYYTPLPVVKFIVRAVDDILKIEFNIKAGLADHSKLKDADGFHKVQILDPAAGTGTFLAEVIDKIHSHFAGNKGAWQGYCADHLIPRVNGFEILMASYAMAHFKLDMKLKETGYNGDGASRLRVYLTNSLEEPPKEVPELFMEKWLTDEAKEANNVKKNTPVMVVLGNPPYSGESANITSEEFLAPYKKEPGGKEKLKERNPKWLNDDYVKFIRYGQTFIEKYGAGVLAFINNHGFLDNPTFRGMRWHLLHTFDKMYILNLHGNSRKKETCPDGSKDENVFDIQQGVSINLFIKTGKNNGLAQVFYSDLYGLRKFKYDYLDSNDIVAIQWDEVVPQGNNYSFANIISNNRLEYEKGFSINDMFLVNGVGITTAHDDFVISENKDKLINRFSQFKKSPAEKTLLHEKFNVNDKEGWDILKGWKNIQNQDDLSYFVKSIIYRPFDNRYIFYEDTLVWRTVTKIMRHFIISYNVGLMVCQQQKTDGFYHCLVHKYIVESSYVSNKTSEIGYSLPLYLYSEKVDLDETEKRRPNLNNEIVQTIAQKTGLLFTEEKTENDKAFAPIDILDYIYAVLHSPAYRTKYKELLKIDFPRIPYPASTEQFCRLASLGSVLRKLHLMEDVSPANDKATFPVAGSNEIAILKYEKGKVFINKTQYFDNVPLEAWDFYIGGYQPAQKWLKDRKGRMLIFDEIEHYRKIITVLALTADLQRQIDEEFYHE
jgi:predicted helicase